MHLCSFLSVINFNNAWSPCAHLYVYVFEVESRLKK